MGRATYNALKKWLSAIIYGVNIMTFIIAGTASRPPTLVRIVTASLGGCWRARGVQNPGSGCAAG